jgi:hypothetical protein
MLPDYTMSSTLENATMRTAYSFYNPTGEATMQIFSGSTVVKSISQTETGFIQFASNFTVNITMNSIGGTGNMLEARCKVISTDVTTANTSTILRDAVQVSTGATAINLSTTPSINYANKLAYSIEGSAIIKRNIS